MKTKNIFWAALSMTAALVMTACSSIEDNMMETPQAPSTSKIIPYTVTVNGGATTRATVADDNKTLKFATGDKLYVTGTDIKGVLDIQTGDGSTTGPGTASATFSGDLTYSGSGTPASDLSLTATLVSAQQTDGSEVTIDATTGAVTVNYPSTAYCADVATAVLKYSNLTGTSTYSTKSFSLTQQTAFLNFVITFEDATTTGTELSAVVSNNSAAICTANVTTTTESEKVVAKFVLPVASTTTLSSATVTMGSKAALNITNATLTGKVYNVTKTQAAAAKTLAEATAGDIGKIAGKDGKIYATKADAEAVATGNAVAKIIYVGSSTGDATYNHGLALALTDEGSSGMAWEAAKTACTNKNTSATVKSASWMLPSKTQWETMGATSSTYTTLRNGFTSVGGSDLKSGLDDYYWSSSEYADEILTDGNGAWKFSFNNGGWLGNPKSFSTPLVRACLAF